MTNELFLYLFINFSKYISVSIYFKVYILNSIKLGLTIFFHLITFHFKNNYRNRMSTHLPNAIRREMRN